MALSENDPAKLDRLGIENVKLKLTDADPVRNLLCRD
jgi:hypothetical protein